MNIRNFVIISHVDHGKSTLADRLLEITGTISKEKLVPQFLDRMPLERERGITIKMQPVRMNYKCQMPNAEHSAFSIQHSAFVLNLIDTPGHSDFSYEVSRGLAAVEGAVLLVDATKGVQAQTLANFHLAERQGLTIIPAINKIDLPTARIEECAEQFREILGIGASDILKISGKTGVGVDALLARIVERVPPPTGDEREHSPSRSAPGWPDKSASDLSYLRALIFDSHFDVHKGIIAYVRVFGGTLKARDIVRFFHAGAEAKVGEVGVFRPNLTEVEMLGSGEIGYIATGLKDASLVRVGDTVVERKSKNEKAGKPSGFTAGTLSGRERVMGKTDIEALPGYKEPQPLVFASFYPTSEEGFPVFKVSV
jgi:GTP-binding protein LepA